MTKLVAAWERFWFAPQSTATLALLRIVLGSLVFVWALSLLPDVGAFLTDSGVVPAALASQRGLLQLFDGAWAAWALVVVLAVGAAALAVGFHTRIAAVVVLIGVMSIERRGVLMYNAGDELIRILAFYVALSPAGAAVSLDRRRHDREHFWEFPERAPWALRLMQIQVSVIYLSSVWEKLHGFTWRNGTAVAYALQLDDLHRFPLPAFAHTWAPAVAMLTWGALATEFAVGVLVWTRWRLPALAAGAVMHLSFSYAMRLGFFSTAVWTLYLAFLPPELSERILFAGRRLATRKKSHRSLRV